MYEVQKCKLHPQKLNNYQILYHITDKAIYLINICYVCYIHKKMLDLKKTDIFIYLIGSIIYMMLYCVIIEIFIVIQEEKCITRIIVRCDLEWGRSIKPYFL